MKYAKVPAIVVKVASRKYGALMMSINVTFSTATFRGVKKSLTLDIAYFLIDSVTSVTTPGLMKSTSDSSVAFTD